MDTHDGAISERERHLNEVVTAYLKAVSLNRRSVENKVKHKQKSPAARAWPRGGQVILAEAA